ncbi:30S ribosomal protein S12 methylthiotransferase RimO [Magnetococcales bacterium HHB-1]
MPQSPQKVGVISLGCPKNQVDTEVVLGQFLTQGYTFTADPEEADILLVNTCGFIREAVEESQEAVEEMAEIKKRFPEKKLVVMGCLVERDGKKMQTQFPQIDVALGTAQYPKVIPILAENKTTLIPRETPQQKSYLADASEIRARISPPHMAYLKIAEGCNNPCSFCIIPQLRGPFQSRPIDDIVQEARQLAQEGVKEINLVAQDTTLYGRDLERRTDLATLLNALEQVEDLNWIRLLYLYPTLITDALLDQFAQSKKVLPYFDIPLQHSHSDILKSMCRSERSEALYRLIERIRQKIPHATLRTTMIVGFPGETEHHFQHLKNFIETIQFDHLGVFVYSDEPQAAAYHLPDKVSQEVAEERQEELMALQQRISQQRLKRFLGKTIPLLVDGVSQESEHLLVGHTQHQAHEIDGITYINRGHAKAGDLVMLRITETYEYDLMGEIV